MQNLKIKREKELNNTFDWGKGRKLSDTCSFPSVAPETAARESTV